MERFWNKVNKTESCWLWIASVGSNNGYGCIKFEGKTQQAHRVSWKLRHGEIPAGMLVLHRCDIPLCVNPEHLFLGTQSDNMRDCRDKGRLAIPVLCGLHNHNARKTHCKQGHLLVDENVYRYGTERQCRICKQQARRKYELKQRALC